MSVSKTLLILHCIQSALSPLQELIWRTPRYIVGPHPGHLLEKFITVHSHYDLLQGQGQLAPIVLHLSEFTWYFQNKQ